MNEHFEAQINGTPSETMTLFYMVKTEEGVTLDKIAHSKGNFIIMPGMKYLGSEKSIPVFASKSFNTEWTEWRRK